MKRIPVESASEIVTVDETLSKRELASFSKSIVRLKPSAIAEASDVKIAAEDLRNTALAVKVLPRPPANRLIMAAQAGNIVVTQMPTDSRSFVLTSVDAGKSELLEYLSSLCDKEGL
jgi:hypothetical protein